MKRWLVVLSLAAALLLSLPTHGFAADNGGTNAVYVAGNPDLYPFEYYDPNTDSYLGIMPELYKEISQTTGLEFVYIRPGMVNQQNRMAKNGQVDLISAHIKGELESAKGEIVITRLDGDGEICVAFSAITPQWVEEPVRAALENVSEHHLLQLALGVPDPMPEQKLYILAAAVAAFLLLIIAVLAFIMLRQKAKKKKSSENLLIDPLTGIGNKKYFESTYLSSINSANFALYYLCYISLNVQRIVQYLGLLKAEEIQRYAADVLSRTAADEDFAARISDGVFLLAFQAPSEEAAAERIGEILNQINGFEGTFLEDHRILFRAGVYWLDSANLPVETAVFNARQGNLVAIESQRPYIFADQKMLNREASKAELNRKLLGALENREFLLYMQMIVDRSGRIVGAESLTRWMNREDGLLSPAMFIEPLKSAGLVDKLDFFILEEACRQLEQWKHTGSGHLWLSCNFARPTMSRNDFSERFRSVLNRYDFDHSRLVIELTEDSLMDNSAEAYSNVLECKNMGCQIALDDLGSGFSSLQDLCDYPIDMIKIDRHILLKSNTVRGNALLRGLAKLGHDMGMNVLCEGIETESENRCALDAGCDFIQGFYFSRVLPQDEANLFYQRKTDSQSREICMS